MYPGDCIGDPYKYSENQVEAALRKPEGYWRKIGNSDKVRHLRH